MVKFRGIEVSIISQFDIRKLPEFRFRQTSPPPNASADKTESNNAVASCYVPIYAGSQIWFEYSVEGPHPPGAGYFFKLLLDGQVVTSWDCTEKHDYNGKMMYNILCESKDESTGKPAMVRQALTFSGEMVEECEPNEQTDVVEIRVHRIEGRKRIRNLQVGTGGNNVNSKTGNSIQLPDGGLLEPGFPHRRYKYQLLDPVDEPYATFRFFYRTLDYLKRHGIVGDATLNDSSPATSPTFHDASSVLRSSSNPKDDSKLDVVIPSSPPAASDSTLPKSASKGSDVYLPQSDSEESLSIVTRDSVEDLPSTVPRSPKSPSENVNRSPQTFDEILNKPDMHRRPPPSPTKSPLSPRRRLKKNLSVTINGVEFNLERKKRPLSPFTSGGLLRKLAPDSAPPHVAEFGPTVKDEVHKLDERERKSKTEQPHVPALKGTTRIERGGEQLMSFLGRRIRARS